MSGLRFESMADMPPRMRELYARQQMPGLPRRRRRPQSITARPPSAESCALTARRRRGGTTS